MNPTRTSIATQVAVKPAPRRPPVLRSAVVLAAGTLATVAFILVLGDVRRKNNALTQARWHAAKFTERIDESGLLPLQLRLDTPPDGAEKMLALDWLPAETAVLLRRAEQRVLAAQTPPVRQDLGLDGRAVIFFQNGRFEVQWLAPSEFDAALTAQKAELRRLSPLERFDAPSPP